MQFSLPSLAGEGFAPYYRSPTNSLALQSHCRTWRELQIQAHVKSMLNSKASSEELRTKLQGEERRLEAQGVQGM